MAAYQVLLLNTAVPQIQAAQAGDTYVVPRDIAFSAALTLSAGTANGVPYLNGSKVLTTGSALTFNGSNTLTIDGGSTGYILGPTGECLIGEDSGAVYIANGFGVTPAIPILFGHTSTTEARYTVGSAAFHRWLVGSEQMRLTSTGLGIGTSSPAYKLDVTGSANITSFLRVGATPATGGDIRLPNTGIIAGRNAADSSNRVMLQLDSSDRVLLQEGSVVIDSSGNLGLGVTPSAWHPSTKAIDVSAGAAFWGSSVAFGVAAGVYGNAVYDSVGYKYKNTANALAYEQAFNGTHRWYNAASGTAGDPITFSQVMTLDASGNLLVGTTSASIGASGRGVIEVNSTSESVFASKVNGTLAAISGFASSTEVIFGAVTNVPVLFRTNNTERARITSGGDFQTSSGNSVMVGGTAARATTAGTNRVDIFDGTAPVGTLANGISLYSSSGEAYVMDAAGNATLFSPHDAATNEWIFKSKHTPSGKVLRIDVERLLRFVNDHFGLDAIHEFTEE